MVANITKCDNFTIIKYILIGIVNVQFTSQDSWRDEVARRLTVSRMTLFPTTAAASVAMGKAHSNLTMWEGGYRQPTIYGMFHVADVYNKHPAYLAGYTQDVDFPKPLPGMDEDLIGLPRWFMSANGKPLNLRTAIQRDNSLDGLISKGAILLIDIEDKTIRDGVFAFDYSGAMKLFKVKIDGSGKISLLTHKQAQNGEPGEEFPADQRSEIEGRVIGRVATWVNSI